MACYGSHEGCHNDHYVEFGRGRAVVYFFILLRLARALAPFPPFAQALCGCFQVGSAPQLASAALACVLQLQPRPHGGGTAVLHGAFSSFGLLAPASCRAPPPFQQLLCACIFGRRWASTARQATHPTRPPYFASQNLRAKGAQPCGFFFLISNTFANVAKGAPVKYYGGKNPARVCARESLPDANSLHVGQSPPAALRVAGSPGARQGLRATPAPRFAALFVGFPCVGAAQFRCASPSAARFGAPQLISDKPNAVARRPLPCGRQGRRIV